MMNDEFKLKHSQGETSVSFGKIDDVFIKDFLASIDGADKVHFVVDSFLERSFSTMLEEISSSKIETLLSHSCWEVSEEIKSPGNLQKMWEEFLQHRLSRKSHLVIVGGGCLGDLGLFAASTYKRGIKAHIWPTTLLSQIDSSLGGKSAINLQDKKNLAGTIYHPQSLRCDRSLLFTLKPQDLQSGWGELLKYKWGFSAMSSILRSVNIESTNSLPSEELIRGSLKIKKELVEQDEFDRTGARAQLNLGHTFAHGIESCLKNFPHGVAVFYGMRMAMELSKAYQLPRADYDRLKLDWERIAPEMPSLNEIKQEQFFESMRDDKKWESGKMSFVLFTGYGQCELRSIESMEPVINAVRDTELI